MWGKKKEKNPLRFLHRTKIYIKYICIFISSFTFINASVFFNKENLLLTDLFSFGVIYDLWPAVSCRSWWRRWWIWTLSSWKRTQMPESEPEPEPGPADTPRSKPLKPVEDQHLPFIILLLCLLSNVVRVFIPGVLWYGKWRLFLFVLFMSGKLRVFF